MRAGEADARKIKELAQRVTARDLIWLRQTVTYALNEGHDVASCILTALNRAKDPAIGRETIRTLAKELTNDELVWFIDNYKSAPQHEKRKRSKSR